MLCVLDKSGNFIDLFYCKDNHNGRIRLGVSFFTILSEKHFRCGKYIEKVLHANNRGARNIQSMHSLYCCFTSTVNI